MRLEQRSDRGEEVSHMVGGGARDSRQREPGASWSLRKCKEEEGAAVIGGQGGTGPGDVGP